MANKSKKVPVKKEKEAATDVRAHGDWYHPFEAMRREMDRLFEGMTRGWPRWEELEPTRLLGRAGERASLMVVPRTDVSENGKAYSVSLELPGMEDKDVEISVADNIITISGEKKSEREEKKENYYLSERSFGSFRRSFPVPADVAADKITASVDKGVLTVTLPKASESKSKTRKIAVKSK